MILTVDGAETCVYTGAHALDRSLPTVLFVHGAAHDHSVWALQSRYFAHHGRNVLAVDLPAHGRSGGAPLASVEAMAAWLPRLLDAAGVEQAALVGHSMGALATLACAGSTPMRVTRIALLGPAVPMVVSDALLDSARADDHLAYELVTSWAHSAGKQLGRNPAPGMSMTGTALRLLERSRPGLFYADLAACRAYSDGLAAAARVCCPALVILGARDLMAPPKGAQALLDALSDRKIVTLPDTGHSMMAEQPDAVLDALRAFL